MVRVISKKAVRVKLEEYVAEYCVEECEGEWRKETQQDKP